MRAVRIKKTYSSFCVSKRYQVLAQQSDAILADNPAPGALWTVMLGIQYLLISSPIGVPVLVLVNISLSSWRASLTSSRCD